MFIAEAVQLQYFIYTSLLRGYQHFTRVTVLFCCDQWRATCGFKIRKLYYWILRRPYM